MGLADSLGSLIPEAPKLAEVPKRSGSQEPKTLIPQAPKRPEMPLQGAAKSTHPDFEPVKVYVRKSTRRDAEYKYQAGGGKHLSDLMEELLQRYLSS